MKNIFLTFVITLAISTNVFAESKSELENTCLVKAIKNAPSNQSIEEVRHNCLSIKTLNSLDKRIKLEKETSDNPFSITPHRPNYLLPFTYAHIKNEPYVDSIENNELDNFEIIFQVSIKYLAVENFIINNLDLQIAFTSISWWQAYNSDISSPFRETNYEPEIILDYQKPFQFLGTTIDNAFISLNHESNGKSGNLSRSWNRIIAGMIWVNNDVSVALKTWWRFPENGLNDLGMPEDDNPNIEKYLGHGELNLLWQISEHHNINMMLRNNLRSDNKGAIKIGWSYPLSKRLKGYVEYFNGYGESLIYYNHHIERIGVGIKLTDWF